MRGEALFCPDCDFLRVYEGEEYDLQCPHCGSVGPPLRHRPKPLPSSLGCSEQEQYFGEAAPEIFEEKHISSWDDYQG